MAFPLAGNATDCRWPIQVAVPSDQEACSGGPTWGGAPSVSPKKRKSKYGNPETHAPMGKPIRNYQHFAVRSCCPSPIQLKSRQLVARVACQAMPQQGQKIHFWAKEKKSHQAPRRCARDGPLLPPSMRCILLIFGRKVRHRFWLLIEPSSIWET